MNNPFILGFLLGLGLTLIPTLAFLYKKGYFYSESPGDIAARHSAYINILDSCSPERITATASNTINAVTTIVNFMMGKCSIIEMRESIHKAMMAEDAVYKDKVAERDLLTNVIEFGKKIQDKLATEKSVYDDAIVAKESRLKEMDKHICENLDAWAAAGVDILGSLGHTVNSIEANTHLPMARAKLREIRNKEQAK